MLDESPEFSTSKVTVASSQKRQWTSWILDVVIGESATIFELLACEDERLLVRFDEDLHAAMLPWSHGDEDKVRKFNDTNNHSFTLSRSLSCFLSFFYVSLFLDGLKEL